MNLHEVANVKLVQNAAFATMLDSQVGTFGTTRAACVDASLARS